MGTVAGVAAHFRARADRPVGVLWVDAHTDMNTPDTTPSGNVHGMSLAVLTGCGGPGELLELAGEVPAVPPHCACVLGARDVDPGERVNVRETGVQVITMSDVDERGLAASVERALDDVTRGTAGIHLSFDLDAIDPMVAPGVGTPVPGGFSYREAHLICEKVARTGALVSLEIVELNPVLDMENRTARLAVGLISSALGKTIL
jgi:arginase